MARMEMDRKTLRKKLKKVVDKLEGMRYNKEVRESEQALKKALNIENFIVQKFSQIKMKQSAKLVRQFQVRVSDNFLKKQ